MSDLDFKTEQLADDLHTSLTIRSIPRGLIEVKFNRQMGDVLNSSYTLYYTIPEFREFFEPMINELKERFDNDENFQQR